MYKLMVIIFMALLCQGHYCSKRTIIDLTHGVDERAINFPGSAPFRWTDQWAGKDPNGVWFSSNDFSTGEHCATHLDAPYHFNKLGRTMEQIPVERFFATGILINASIETGSNYLYKLPEAKLVEWERNNGFIPVNSVVFVNFGWSKFYPNRKLYLGPSDTDLRYPGVSKEAAQWLADTKRVVGVAVDTPSLDQGEHTEAHVILTNNDMYIIENIKLNVPLPPKFKMVALPMKLINGTGAPVRVMALI